MFVEADARLVIQKCLSSPASPHSSTCPPGPQVAILALHCPMSAQSALYVVAWEVSQGDGTPPLPHITLFIAKKWKIFVLLDHPLPRGWWLSATPMNCRRMRRNKVGGSHSLTGLVVLQRWVWHWLLKEGILKSKRQMPARQHLQRWHNMWKYVGNSLIGAVHPPCGDAYANKPDKDIMKQSHIELLVQVIEDLKNDALSCAMVFGRGVVAGRSSEDRGGDQCLVGWQAGDRSSRRRSTSKVEIRSARRKEWHFACGKGGTTVFLAATNFWHAHLWAGFWNFGSCGACFSHHLLQLFLASLLNHSANKRKRSFPKVIVCLAYGVLQRTPFSCFYVHNLWFWAPTDAATSLCDWFTKSQTATTAHDRAKPRSLLMRVSFFEVIFATNETKLLTDLTRTVNTCYAFFKKINMTESDRINNMSGPTCWKTWSRYVAESLENCKSWLVTLSLTSEPRYQEAPQGWVFSTKVWRRRRGWTRLQQRLRVCDGSSPLGMACWLWEIGTASVEKTVGLDAVTGEDSDAGLRVFVGHRWKQSLITGLAKQCNCHFSWDSWTPTRQGREGVPFLLRHRVVGKWSSADSLPSTRPRPCTRGLVALVLGFARHLDVWSVFFFFSSPASTMIVIFLSLAACSPFEQCAFEIVHVNFKFKREVTCRFRTEDSTSVSLFKGGTLYMALGIGKLFHPSVTSSTRQLGSTK